MSAQLSGIFRAIRDAYDLYVESHYQRAEHDCNGAMLSAVGRVEGVDAYDLFRGRRDFAERCASDELCEWWATNGRITYREFEASCLTTAQVGT